MKRLVSLIAFITFAFLCNAQTYKATRISFKTTNRIWNNQNVKSRSKNADAIKTTIIVAPYKKKLPKNGNYKDTIFINNAKYLGKINRNYQLVNPKNKSQYVLYFSCDDNSDDFAFMKLFLDKNKKPTHLTAVRRLKFPTVITYYTQTKMKLKSPTY
jgi:hypothetical protein